jgi:hypothetical protein
VTSTGVAGGLSPDGSLLVLAEPPDYNGLRTQSRFLVVATRTLSLAATLVLDGEFGFDAISPDNHTLFLIEHATGNDLISYVVRAYDLGGRHLVEQAIIDKRNAGEKMRGYPVARTTSNGGAWVYTLYHRGSGKPFIHALNASGRWAACIDLAWKERGNFWNARLQLTDGGRRLVVRSGGSVVARVDTRTLRVV